jgi:hypothetical protein
MSQPSASAPVSERTPVMWLISFGRHPFHEPLDHADRSETQRRILLGRIALYVEWMNDECEFFHEMIRATDWHR